MNSILTVTTASNTYDLTVLATVKAELGITDNSKNVQLQTWITQASRIAAAYCNRVFAQETLTESFRPNRNAGSIVVSNRSETLVLGRAPIASITSVTLDDTALTSAQYEIDANPGMLYRLDDSGYRSCWSFCKSAIVVYVAGYELLATLPQDIERAVILMVNDMNSDQQRDPMMIEKEIPGVSRYRWWAPGDSKTVLPIEIAGLLDPYRNYVIR